jgi:hypothetical protein
VENLPDVVSITTRFTVDVFESPAGRLVLASATRTATTQPSILKSALGRVVGFGGAALTGKALLDFAIGAYAYYACSEDHP